jgi:hypothetical protein
MADLDPGSLRYKILESAKRFKSSWIELGQMLFTVWKDRHWRAWGYLEFESNCLKEIGIREATARKLLHSYHFLEQEEPSFLQQQREAPSGEPTTPCPSYDAVYVLRSAKTRANLPEPEYAKLRNRVLERAEEAPVVRRELRLLQERLAPPEEPEVARAKRRTVSLRRIVTTLRTAESVAEADHLIPPPLLKEFKALIAKLEAHLRQEK